MSNQSTAGPDLTPLQRALWALTIKWLIYLGGACVTNTTTAERWLKLKGQSNFFIDVLTGKRSFDEYNPMIGAGDQ
jgi:hypothetical protein